MKRAIVFLLLVAVLALVIDVVLFYRKYNIILVTVDTLRADYLSCYNKDARPTPEIDSIAQAGVLFRQAFTLMPVTLPAHASLLTSRPPHELRLFDNGQKYQQDFPMLSELLVKEGYATAAFVSLGVLKKKFGLHKGFQTYKDEFAGGWYKSASEVNEEAFRWLESVKDKPFFAWLHYSDPHEPYLPADSPPDTEIFVDGAARLKVCLGNKSVYSLDLTLRPGKTILEFRPVPETKESGVLSRQIRKIYCDPYSQDIEVIFGEGWAVWRLRTGSDLRHFTTRGVVELRNRGSGEARVQVRFSGGITQRFDAILRNYAAEVRYVDAQIGALWDKVQQLGMEQKTIFVITSDHGEGLGSHGRTGHGYPLFNELLKVPLVIYYPYLSRRGRAVEDLVDHLDVMPTILDLVHIRNPQSMGGRSLASHLSWSAVNRLQAKKGNRSLIFAATPSGVARSYALQNGKFKLIQIRDKSVWIYRAYDLSRDPREHVNLLHKSRALLQQNPFAEWKDLLGQYAAENEKARRDVSRPAMDAEDAEMLEALGYVGNE